MFCGYATKFSGATGGSWIYSCSRRMHRLASMLKNDLRAIYAFEGGGGYSWDGFERVTTVFGGGPLFYTGKWVRSSFMREEKTTYLWSEHKRVGVNRDPSLTRHRYQPKEFCCYHCSSLL